MHSLEELLLKRQLAPEGPGNIPPQSIAGITQKLFEGGIDTVMGLFGVGPETQANQVGQMIGTAGPIFKIGGKALQKIGNTWRWLDEDKTISLMNSMKEFGPAQVIKQIDELKDTTLPIVKTSPPPPLKSTYLTDTTNQKAAAGMSRSKLNLSAVKAIRTRGQS